MGRQREFDAVNSSHWTGTGRCRPGADTGYVCSTLDTGRSGPRLAWRFNDRNVPETVSWANPGDRPDTLHNSHPDVCSEQQSAANSAWSALPSAAM